MYDFVDRFIIHKVGEYFMIVWGLFLIEINVEEITPESKHSKMKEVDAKWNVVSRILKKNQFPNLSTILHRSMNWTLLANSD